MRPQPGEPPPPPRHRLGGFRIDALLYSLNREHLLWPAISKALDARAALLDRIALELRDVGRSGGTAAIYGSAARGDGEPRSDIDLVIVWPESYGADERGTALERVHRAVDIATGNELDIIDLDPGDLRRLVGNSDALIEVWRSESRTLAGKDLRRRIEAVA